MQKVFAPAKFERIDDRGRLVEVLAEGSWKAVIHGAMNAGAVLGNQYHRLTRIYFHLTSGSADVDIVRVSDTDRHRVRLTPGKGTYLEPGEAHAVRFNEPSEFIMLKSQRHDPLEPDTYPYDIDDG